MGHGFIGYPKGRNVERALGSSCPCILCIPIHTGADLAVLVTDAEASAEGARFLWGSGDMPPPPRKILKSGVSEMRFPAF